VRAEGEDMSCNYCKDKWELLPIRYICSRCGRDITKAQCINYLINDKGFCERLGLDIRRRSLASYEIGAGRIPITIRKTRNLAFWRRVAKEALRNSEAKVKK
jgi:hypothetical protein